MRAEGEDPDTEKSSAETLLWGEYQKSNIPISDLIDDSVRKFAFYPPGENKAAPGWNNSNPPKIESSYQLTTGNYVDIVLYSESRAIGRVVSEPGTVLLFVLGLLFIRKRYIFS